jgi:tetratricopeptide (TPR) repeat protein/CHASE2 domain-containing sensor protein
MGTKDEAGAAATPRRASIVGTYVVVGVITTLLLGGVKLVWEKTSPGHDFEVWMFGKLQSQLPSVDRDNPIVILDISGLPGGKPGEPTSREKLTEIIGALAMQRPRAIAVDVNFSPKPTHFATDDDANFFDDCLKFKRENNLPIFLAVGETKAGRPDQWRGLEEYAELAAAVAADENDTTKMPLWVKSGASPQRLNTINYALALEYQKDLPGPPEWIKWATERNDIEHHAEPGARGDGLVYADTLVNYSKLDAMESSAQRDVSAESVAETGNRYHKKLVLVGCVGKCPDSFNVPVRKPPVSGVLMLASATYTLIKEPLFELKPTVRLLLDFALAVLIVAIVAVIRYRNPHDPSWHGREAIFIYLAMFVVFIAGCVLVWASGVMWLDFMFIVGALFLHPKLQDRITNWWERRRQRAPAKRGTGLKTLVLILVALLALASDARAQGGGELCQDRVAAVILSFRAKKGARKEGACYLRDRRVGVWQKLSASDAHNRKQLRAGQDLSCDRGCSVVIFLCGTHEEFEVDKDREKPYRVFNAFSDYPKGRDQYPAVPAISQIYRPGNPPIVIERIVQRAMRFLGKETMPDDYGAATSNRVQDGLSGPVRGVKIETAKIAVKNGKPVEGPRTMLETATYDQKGNRVDNAYFREAGGTLTGREVYKYDDRGNIVEMTLHNADGSLLAKEVYSYEFDAVGNWVKMTTSVAMIEGGKITLEPSEVTYRTISYYLENDTLAMMSRTETLSAATPAITPTPTPTGTIAAHSPSASALSHGASVPAGGPLSKNEIITMLKGGIASSRVEQFVAARGVNFEVTPQVTSEIQSAGGDRSLIGAITEKSSALTSSAMAEADAKVSSEGAWLSHSTATPDDEAFKAAVVKGLNASPADTGREFTAALMLGNRERDTLDYVAAERAYVKASLIDEQDARAFYGLGNVYADQKKWEDAERAYRRAVKLSPYFAPAHLALGFVLAQPLGDRGDTPERLADAESSIWRAAELQPGYDDAYDLLADVLRKRGVSGGELVSEYRRAVSTSRDSVKPLLLLSGALRSSGLNKEADEQLKRAAEVAQASGGLVLTAEAFESQRQYRQAARLLRDALSQSPHDPRALSALGRVMFLRGRYSQSVRPLKDAVVADPKNFEPHFLLALAYLKQNSLFDAERTLDSAAALTSQGGRQALLVAYGFGRLGDAYVKAGRTRDAERAYERALSLDPEDSETKDKLSGLRTRPGR